MVYLKLMKFVWIERERQFNGIAFSFFFLQCIAVLTENRESENNTLNEGTSLIGRTVTPVSFVEQPNE